MLRKTIAASVAVAVLAFASVSPASADRGGTPNEKACTGQVIAALAQNSELKALKITFGDILISSRGLIQERCASGDYSQDEIVEAAVQKVREAAAAAP